jgi:catalase
MLSRQLLQAHIVDGIGYSPDKMLQARLLSYGCPTLPLGDQLRTNSGEQMPFCNQQLPRDGQMRTDGNGGENPNYFPNSFDDIQIDQAYKEPPF